MNRVLAALLVAISALTAPGRLEAAEHRVTFVVVDDTTRDVVRVPRGCPDTGCAPPSYGRDKAGADITSLEAEYGSVLRLGAQVRAVGKRVYFLWRIRASGEDYYAALIKRRGKLTTRFFGGDFEETACEGLAGALDADTRFATLDVPADCFGSPGHVRLGLWTQVVRGKYYVFVDDALRERFDPYLQKPRLSERLDRL